MELTWQMYAIACPLIFLASFIDSIAGGGGLISLPAYYMAGLPPYMASGTNKLSACLGTITAAGRYTANKRVCWKAAIPAFAGGLPGSALGAMLQQHIPENTVRLMMIILIPVVAVIVLGTWKQPEGKRLLPDHVSRSVELTVSFFIGFTVCFYDGLAGPGSGTFLIIMFSLVLGVHTVDASGTAKIVNLAGNIGALVTFLVKGNVLIALGIPAACCSVCGAMLGSGMTIKRGTGFIRKMLIVVLALLLAKMIYDLVA